MLAMSTLTAFSAQLSSAKVTEITGSVNKYSVDGRYSPLKVGDILVQGDSISVSALSSASLVFSNGSEIVVQENTSLNIAKFEQEPFAETKSYEQLQADPSKSQVLLELNYGSLNGHVKSLRPGSSFDINTPLGTAAIRGTKFVVKLLYNTNTGDFTLLISNLDGKVDFLSNYAGGIDYNKGNVGDKSVDAKTDDVQTDNIPAERTVVVRIGKDNPDYQGIVNAVQSFIPSNAGPGVISLPLPEITPEDPGVIVVSPEDQDPV
jgi:hypothetical protein